MKIHSIKLNNIGPFSNQSFTMPDGITAICGSNGSGKTTILESIPLVLFGTTPSRSGSLYDRVTKEFKGDAVASIFFDVAGTSYCATVEANTGRKTPVANYYLYKDGGSEPIAGPKFTDYSNKITSIVGSADLFFASVFSSQKDYGDICSAKPAERKEIFSQMLSLGMYDEIRQKIDVKYEAIKYQLEPKKWEIDRDNKSLAEANDYLKAVAIDDIKQGIVDNRNLIDTYMETYKKEVSYMAGLKADILAYNTALGLKRDLLDQLAVVRNDIKTLGEYHPSTVITQKDIDTTQAIIDAEIIQLTNMTEDRNKFMTMAHNKELVAAEGKALASNLKIARDKVALLKETPNEPCCMTCKFTADAREAMSMAATFNQQLTVKRKEYQEMIVPDFDLDAYNNLDATIRQRQDEIKRARDIVNSIAAKKAEYDTKKATLLEREASLLKQIDDNAKIISSKSIVDIQASHDESNTRANHAVLQTKVCQQKLEELTKDMQSYNSMSERRDKLIESIAYLTKLTTELEKEYEVYGVLLKAFGKNGITQLVIDSAASEFETIANDLLAIASNGDMSVNFVTQRTLKDGSIAEALDIIVHHKGLSYDVSEYSGGEQKLIKTIIRLTLSLYMARKSENKLRSLFIDEIFDDLDADNSQRILAVINHLQSYFDQIILISHSDELLVQMPNVIRLGATK